MQTNYCIMLDSHAIDTRKCMYMVTQTTVAHELHNNFILTIVMSCKYRPWLASGDVTQMLALLILDKPA